MHGEYVWLNRILEDVKDVEAPDSFKKWALLFCISAAAKRRLLLSLRGKIRIYPNIYVMLIADSGFGKQFSIDLAESILKKTKKIRMLSGQNSVEAVIEQLGKQITLEGGEVIKNAEVALTSGEFSTLLLENPKAFTDLTALYDCADEWKKTLRKGQDRLQNVYISMLTATNMEHLHNTLSDTDVKGGFVARTLLIKESKITHLDSLLGEGAELDYEDYAKRLVEITAIPPGRFRIDANAVRYYDEWYHEFYDQRIQRADKTGFLKRLRAHILKVSMVLSLIERDDLIITLEHMKDAKDLCFSLTDASAVVSRETGKSKYRSQMALIVQQLMKAPNYLMTQQALMSSNQGEFTYKEFDEVIITLIRQEYIVRTDVVSGDDEIEPAFRLSPRAIAELEKGKED